MDLPKRILRILDRLAGEQLEHFLNTLDQGLNDWERRLGLGEQGQTQEPPQSGPTGNQFKYNAPRPNQGRYSDLMLKDLAVFGLAPPVSLAELKQARKRELKKYHPDRFAQEPEKIESAKRIVQIIGESYDRLLRQLS